jgi:hypothetical protein
LSFESGFGNILKYAETLEKVRARIRYVRLKHLKVKVTIGG